MSSNNNNKIYIAIKGSMVQEMPKGEAVLALVDGDADFVLVVEYSSVVGATMRVRKLELTEKLV